MRLIGDSQEYLLRFLQDTNQIFDHGILCIYAGDLAAKVLYDKKIVDEIPSFETKNEGISNELRPVDLVELLLWNYVERNVQENGP